MAKITKSLLDNSIMRLDGEYAEKFHKDMNTPPTPEQIKYQKEAVEYFKSKCKNIW